MQKVLCATHIVVARSYKGKIELKKCVDLIKISAKSFSLSSGNSKPNKSRDLLLHPNWKAVVNTQINGFSMTYFE